MLMWQFCTVFLALLAALIFMGVCMNVVNAADVSRMTKEELKTMLGNPDVIILDVRSGTDWRASESKIKGAIREESYQTRSWADKYDKGKTYVLYCA